MNADKKSFHICVKVQPFQYPNFPLLFCKLTFVEAVFYAPEWLWISYAHTTQITSNAHNIWGRKINSNLS